VVLPWAQVPPFFQLMSVSSLEILLIAILLWQHLLPT
jgi:hypothetical protein